MILVIDNYNPRDEVCKSDGYGAVGFLEDGTRIPIGVYSQYRDAAAHSNAWLRNTPRADRYEIEKLYSPVLGED